MWANPHLGTGAPPAGTLYRGWTKAGGKWPRSPAAPQSSAGAKHREARIRANIGETGMRRNSRCAEMAGRVKPRQQLTIRLRPPCQVVPVAPNSTDSEARVGRPPPRVPIGHPTCRSQTIAGPEPSKAKYGPERPNSLQVWRIRATPGNRAKIMPSKLQVTHIRLPTPKAQLGAHVRRAHIRRKAARCAAGKAHRTQPHIGHIKCRRQVAKPLGGHRWYPNFGNVVPTSAGLAKGESRSSVEFVSINCRCRADIMASYSDERRMSLVHTEITSAQCRVSAEMVPMMSKSSQIRLAPRSTSCRYNLEIASNECRLSIRLVPNTMSIVSNSSRSSIAHVLLRRSPGNVLQCNGNRTCAKCETESQSHLDENRSWRHGATSRASLYYSRAPRPRNIVLHLAVCATHLGSKCGYIVVMLLICGHFGVILGSIWGRVGVYLGSLRGRCGVDLGTI